MTNRERILLLEVEVKRLKKDNKKLAKTNKKLNAKLDEVTETLKNISDKVNGFGNIQVSYVLNRRDDGYDESQFSRDWYPF